MKTFTTAIVIAIKDGRILAENSLGYIQRINASQVAADDLGHICPGSKIVLNEDGTVEDITSSFTRWVLGNDGQTREVKDE